MFDRTTGHHTPAKLTYNISQNNIEDVKENLTEVTKTTAARPHRACILVALRLVCLPVNLLYLSTWQLEMNHELGKCQFFFLKMFFKKILFIYL